MRCIGPRPTVRTGEIEKLGDKMVEFLITVGPYISMNEKACIHWYDLTINSPTPTPPQPPTLVDWK